MLIRLIDSLLNNIDQGATDYKNDITYNCLKFHIPSKYTV